MSLIRQQFFESAIRPNLAHFSSTVKVREILPHLPCLTMTDKEEIEAKRDNSGNFTAMQTLLENLRRRENWPEEFIRALRNCEHRELADEMSAIYDRLRGIPNNAAPAASVPRSAPAPAPSYSSAGATSTLTTATVHTVPATTSALLSPPSGVTLAPSNAPSTSPAPEPSSVSGLKVKETQPVQEPPTPAPEPPLEPITQPEIAPSVEAPSESPPSAVASAVGVSSPIQNKAPTQTGPAENKTSVLDFPDDSALTSQSTTSLAHLSTPNAEASSTNTSQTPVTKPFTPSQSPQRPDETQVPIAVQDFSEKLPVQDTNPPLSEERVFQEPEEITDPSTDERNNTAGLPVFNSTPDATRAAQATSSAPAVVISHPSSSIEPDYFSKPGVLQHLEPQQNQAAETLPAVQEEPCSVRTGDLEISSSVEASTEPEQSASVAEETNSPVASLDSSSQSSEEYDPALVEAPLIPNQPQEDHYESFNTSHTLVHSIHFAEEAPAENLNGQPPSLVQRSRAVSGDQPSLNSVGTASPGPLHHPSGHDSEMSDLRKSATINSREEETNARPATTLQQDQREEARPDLFRVNNLHVVAAAAAVVLSGAFLAWKLKQ